jgi:POT family proton-dependent oligopeptide transporter
MGHTELPGAETTAGRATFPRSVPYIIGNEAAERFNFYGMRAILVTFLVAQFFNPQNDPALSTVAEAQANKLVHYFVSLSYFMPVLGALAADWFFGKYRVILYVSIVYCLGTLGLALFTHDLRWFQLSLITIAIGAGGIKSCVSANVGDQFDRSNQHLMSKVYGWFYMSINVGSVFSTALIPIIYARYGPEIAFGVPAVLMALATLIFWSGRARYVRVPPTGIRFDREKTLEGLRAASRVLLVFIFIPLFWGMWDMSLSEWVLQARKLDLEVWPGFSLLPEQVQTVNPLFLIAMIPVFTYGVYPLLEKVGLRPTPLRKIGAGLALTALSFVVIAWTQQQIDAGLRPSMWWQVLAYFILSAGEVLVAITGLEYAYTHAPKSMKSMMTALWLLTVSAGNLFVGYVNNSIEHQGFFADLTGAAYYWYFIKLLAAETVVFMALSAFMREKSYVGEE